MERPPEHETDTVRSGEGGEPGVTADLPRRGAGVDASMLPAGERPGDSIGPYRLLGVLGEGGFGVVYLAERRDPIVQRVALKVIKAGMDSRAVIARFEQERQALAVMDHPNIARVFDAGATASGRPYFVMEHVAGEAITAYCDRESLSIRERLELLIPVCEAVQHAHMKGIIHRDLKPSNILVTVKEGRATPKVIDFGVAKAITHALTARTVFTEQGVLIGTPEYMSPEQAEMGATDIDTRSDVYSLGVVLYELLTGALPLDPEELRRAAYVRIQKIIREVDPPRPSTRLSTMGPGAAEAARRRRMEVADLAEALRRELEWLPLKAMRKDRVQRYQSAAAMAEDLRNYLADRPLIAGPESAGYKVRKFVRRHRGPVMAGAAVAAAIVGGALAATWGMVRAVRAEEAAQHDRRVAERVVDYLTRDLLGAHDTFDADPDARVIDLVRRSALEGDGAFTDEPGVATGLAYALGRSFLVLGAPREAEEQLRRAFEMRRAVEAAGGSLVTEIGFRLAESLYRQGRGEEAAALLRPLIAAREEAAGADDRLLVDAKHQLGGALKWMGEIDEAEALYTDVLERRRRALGPGHVDTLIARYNLALVWMERGELAVREAKVGEAIRAKREARTAMKGVWEDMRRHLGAEDRWTIAAASEYASILNRQGRLEEARPIYEATIPVMVRRMGEKNFRTLEARANYGRLLRRAGDVDGAVAAWEAALPGYREVRGRTFPDTLTVTLWLAGAYTARGEAEKAGEILETAWADLAADSSVDEKMRWGFAGRAAAALREAGDEEGARGWEGRVGEGER